jgi:hypothetical protein
MPNQRINIRQINIPKRQVPVDQIISVMGQNPIATGIDTTGSVLGQAILKRAELRRQGEQVAQLAALTGQPNTGQSLTPELYIKGLEQKAALEKAQADAQGGNNMLSPAQLMAIDSGDPRGLIQSSPRGVPREVASLLETTATKRATQSALKEERDRAQADRMDKNILTYSEALEKNPTVKGMRTQDVSLGQMDNVINLAKQGNTVAASAMGTKMARAMGEVGVLTDSDVKRYVQSGQLARGTGDKLSRMMQGRPTDATLEEISQIAAVLKNSYASKVQPVYDTYVNRLSRNLNITPEEAAFRLDVPYTGKKALKALPSSGSGVDLGGGFTYKVKK